MFMDEHISAEADTCVDTSVRDSNRATYTYDVRLANYDGQRCPNHVLHLVQTPNGGYRHWVACRSRGCDVCSKVWNTRHFQWYSHLFKQCETIWVTPVLLGNWRTVQRYITRHGGQYVAPKTKSYRLTVFSTVPLKEGSTELSLPEALERLHEAIAETVHVAKPVPCSPSWRMPKPPERKYRKEAAVDSVTVRCAPPDAVIDAELLCWGAIPKPIPGSEKHPSGIMVAWDVPIDIRAVAKSLRMWPIPMKAGHIPANDAESVRRFFNAPRKRPEQVEYSQKIDVEWKPVSTA